ncbi:phosphopantothenoylcysteine decarboxylase [Pleomassaria siparia CBS 279.74]|uniref:Phosphopantothenoylcysteine decarboxylase n=1 Tax=Pleomassaria siparia CBS 279.74 TaxID=1314801 RepID=A0A6G1JX97_9PLEO|nr:phosphopantothenoylcysteine decarboxylase [Pleomassaria siparia CBS 279.74]
MTAVIQNLKPLHLEPVRHQDAPPRDAFDFPLHDKKIHLLLCASGSVATIKMPNMITALSRHTNLSIRLILTASATQFLQGQSSEQPCLQDMEALPNVDGIYLDQDEWREPWVRGNKILHIELRRWADMMLIAPLSANALAKITQGWSDNLLLSVVRAWDTTGELDPVRDMPGLDRPREEGEGEGEEDGKGIPIKRVKRILVAPSMNTAMWKQPISRKQITVLDDEWGVKSGGWFEVLVPMEKELACGDVGGGAMKDWREIVDVVEERLGLKTTTTTMTMTNKP